MREHFLLWFDTVHDPFFNMAMDEVLLNNIGALNRPLVRIYTWDRPSLSIGSSQHFPAEYREKYTIVRRPTGGGNVFHDIDLTYTAVIPAGHAIAKLDRLESYKVFHEAMLPMLEVLGVKGRLKADETPGVDRATMQCFVAPSKFDIVDDDGSKYAGAAQRRTRNGILHQGSVLLTASGGDHGKLADALLAGLCIHFKVDFKTAQIPGEWLLEAQTLAQNKYSKDSWNHESRH